MAADLQRPFARTAAFYTLGCKVNQAETREWATTLGRAGVELVPFDGPADLYIVNTCTVTHFGDRKSRQVIRQAERANPDASIVVTGCYAEVAPKEIAQLRGVDLVVGTQSKEALVQTLAERGMVPAIDSGAWVHPSEKEGWVTLMPALERHSRAFVKVQDGCDWHCTYCIVPRARGHQRSRSIDALVQQVRLLHDLGYQEAVLTGVQLGAYGRDWDREAGRVQRDVGPNLTVLVERLLAETRMPRIRLSSIQPQDWPNGLLELWADPRMCRHVHLPLQSGSDSVLKRMGRRYRRAEFADLVERLRSIIPAVALTADIMVGFPGETEAEHRESLSFCEEIGFFELHVFRYSARPGTAATRLTGDVPPEVRKRRSDEMQALHGRLSREYRQQFLGQNVDVLWEMQPAHGDGNRRVGLTDNYLRVWVEGQAMAQGTVSPVRLDSLQDEGFLGSPL
ncbi:MAG: tRNA (N(6)-L-threonylcarbamoyladenosine(37)-C(2))-methylthiotransferase MtaB [Chloroflexota bacterium]